MSGNNFVDSLGEHKVADLGAGINVVDGLERVGVPEPDASIRSAATRSKKTVLVRRPANCFDCGGVIREFGLSLRACQRPDHQLVVVAARGQLLSVEAPL